MTVAELAAILATLPPDTLVIIAKDREGNMHSPLDNWWEGAYRAETTWYGDVGFARLTDEDREAGYTDEDVIADGVPAVILAPVS